MLKYKESIALTQSLAPHCPLRLCITSWNHFVRWFCSKQQQHHISLMIAENQSTCTRATGI